MVDSAKKRSCIAHARRRARERYGFIIGPREMASMQIGPGVTELLEKVSNNVLILGIFWHDQPAMIIWQVHYHCPKTFLTPTMQPAHWAKFKRRRPECQAAFAKMEVTCLALISSQKSGNGPYPMSETAS